MPLSLLYANANGNYAQSWPGSPGTTQASIDYPTGYLASSANGERNSVGCQDLPSDAEAIYLVRGASYARYITSGTLLHFLRYNSTDSSDVARSPVLTGSWAWGYSTHATAPGGVGWTPSIVNATEMGLYISVHEVYSDAAALEVTWESGAGGFALFVACLVGSLGPMLTRGDWLALRGHLRELGHRFSESEWVRLVREVRAWASPRRFDLAAGRA
jgi:hypothetical protein